MDKNATIILAVEADRLPAVLNAGNGLHSMSHAEALDTLSNAGTWLGPRGRMEEDERFRQIIPYIVLRQGEKIVTYVRGATGGEARLHGKLSIGLGGHIDIPDVSFDMQGVVNLLKTIRYAAARELEEEIDAGEPADRSEPVVVGLITANDTPVNRVHIGVLIVIDLASDVVVSAKEDSQSDLALMTVGELSANADRLEAWTALALAAL